MGSKDEVLGNDNNNNWRVEKIFSFARRNYEVMKNNYFKKYLFSTSGLVVLNATKVCFRLPFVITAGWLITPHGNSPRLNVFCVCITDFVLGNSECTINKVRKSFQF